MVRRENQLVFSSIDTIRTDGNSLCEFIVNAREREREREKKKKKLRRSTTIP